MQCSALYFMLNHFRSFFPKQKIKQSVQIVCNLYKFYCPHFWLTFLLYIQAVPCLFGLKEKNFWETEQFFFLSFVSVYKPKHFLITITTNRIINCKTENSSKYTQTHTITLKSVQGKERDSKRAYGSHNFKGLISSLQNISFIFQCENTEQTIQ